MLLVISAVTAALYLVATGLHLSAVVGVHERLVRGANMAVWAALAGHLALVVAVVFEHGSVGLVEVRGGITMGGLALTLVYLVLARRFELASLGSLVTPLSALSAMVWLVEPASPGGGSASHASGAAAILLPIHIVLAFLGTAAFLLALVLAVLYVVQERQLKSKRLSPWATRLPSLEKLDRFIVRFVSLGFVVYTVSLLLGLFNQWRIAGLDLDFRSGLSLLTWAIYALIIQARITAGWRGRKAAQLIIVGAVCATGVIVVYLSRSVV